MWWDKLDRKGKMEGRKGGRRGREKKREREVETQGKRVYGLRNLPRKPKTWAIWERP